MTAAIYAVGRRLKEEDGGPFGVSGPARWDMRQQHRLVGEMDRDDATKLGYLQRGTVNTQIGELNLEIVIYGLENRASFL
jgi:hypothetical protein